MRGRGILLGIVGLAITALLAAAVIRTAPPDPAPAPPDPLPPLYDTIRTDLSAYGWPTDETRAITSSFGEFRSTHFHAGIDISTRDRIGAHVLAARDGSVARIRVSPTGYGKILYLRHADGYTTTYAHLDHFSPLLEERVRAEQLRRGIYPVTLRFQTGQIPVRRGELIAYSGETGSGTPHLHFEIRDEHGNAVNPMLCPDFRIHDTIAPGPRRLAFVPLGPGSTVNGRDEPTIIPLRLQPSGEFAFAGPVLISGKAGIALYIRDRSNGTWFRHGVYRHSLLINGHPALRVRFDRVPMQEDQQIGLYYQWEMYHRRKGKFQKLYIDGAHELPLYSPDSIGAGVLGTPLIPAGRAGVRIETEDFNGNATAITGEIIVSSPLGLVVHPQGDSVRVVLGTPGEIQWVLLSSLSRGANSWRTQRRLPAGGSPSLVFPLRPTGQSVYRIVAENAAGVQSPPWLHFPSPSLTRQGPIELRLQRRDSYITAVVTASGMLTDDPRLLIQEGTRERIVALRRVDLDRAEGWFTPDARHGGERVVRATAEVGGTTREAAAILELYPLVPGRADTYLIDGGGLRISSVPESVYDTVWISLERDPSGEHGRSYRLGPSHVVLRRGITVAMGRSASSSGDLYVRGRGRWSLLARALSPTMPVTGRLRRSLGELTLMTDTRGPSVQKLHFPALSRRAVRFSFAYDDDRSGVDYDSVKTYIDGAVVIPEIDGEHHRVHYLSRDPLDRGPHLLTIRLRDNVGNLTTVERRFVVP